MVERAGAQTDLPVTVLALVDSGAYQSIFPLDVAADLGIQAEELSEDPEGGFGVGSSFRVWTTSASIRARILLSELEDDGGEQPWGPWFALSPAFIEHGVFLLGRADFFQVFSVSFETRPNGLIFHLDT